ncbi:Inversin-B [Termitomyces sp. T112]|nr:Inversin-B [Termitomyces sp. T112]KAH0578637.1 hypothetical protein H2248_003773 [Termitomyces sp. 'cryptogamus']
MSSHFKSRSSVIPNSASTPSSNANIGARVYDYTDKYKSDKPGEEIEENARVWSVYLDEAESHDADVMQGYRTIIDGLLVFASLFSAVVTTFVAQTSQALAPDYAQVTAVLLLENNQLLRAAGNSTTLNDIPAASLHPGSHTYSSTDVWVNGFFFTSLGLSLSTALLSVLAKQWIQAYTTIVPGGAKTRALIRHFRFQGTVKWKLGEIIESLPLILHGSVALFLIGLALYTSQLSSPICGVVVAITCFTFLFYLGTLVLPAVFLDCPYRISFLFPLAQLALYAFHLMQCASCFLWQWLQSGFVQVPKMQWPALSAKSFKSAENDAIFLDDSALKHCQYICDTLYWVLNYSSNQSIKQVVFEGVSGLLFKWRSMGLESSQSLLMSKHDLFRHSILFTLDKLAEMASPSTQQDDVIWNPWFKLIEYVWRPFYRQPEGKSLWGSSIAHKEEQWKEIQHLIKTALDRAITRKDHVLFRCLLKWGHPGIQDAKLDWAQDVPLLHYSAWKGATKIIDYMLDNKVVDINQHGNQGRTALHWAAMQNQLDTVIAIVDREKSLIHVRTNTHRTLTALDTAVLNGNYDVARYLLAEGAERPPDALHLVTAQPLLWRSGSVIRALLDLGWNRKVEDAEGRTPIDVAYNGGFVEAADCLEHYQTASIQPYMTVPLTPIVVRGT